MLPSVLLHLCVCVCMCVVRMLVHVCSYVCAGTLVHMHMEALRCHEVVFQSLLTDLSGPDLSLALGLAESAAAAEQVALGPVTAS